MFAMFLAFVGVLAALSLVGACLTVLFICYGNASAGLVEDFKAFFQKK